MIRDLLQDLRYGLRTLRRSPGFAALVVLSLALGIAANTAIFSVFNAVFLRPLPVRDPAGLVLFSEGFGGGLRTGTPRGRLDFYSYPFYRQLRAEDEAFLAIAAQESGERNALLRRSSGADQEATELAIGRSATANYFDVLGVRPALGRTFRPEDETAPGANPVLVLSHACWQRSFGGDPGVVGARVSVNGRPFTVIGVTAPGFIGSRVGSATDFWVPITMTADASRLASPRHRWLLLFGRLEPGVSLATAAASANLSLQRFLADNRAPGDGGAGGANPYIQLEPGGKGVSSLRRNFRTPLVALLAGVGLLFLIVCLNVSHLMLARATGRQREMSLRCALGASRARLLRQTLAESLLLAAPAAAAGMLLTGWLADALVSLVPASGSLSRVLDVSADGRVVAFAAVLTAASILVLCLVPAWQAAARGGQQEALPASRAVAGTGSRRLASRLLLVSQVAFSLVLLVGAGLLAGTLARLRGLDSGVDEQHLLLVEISRSPQVTGLDKEHAPVLYDQLLRRLEEVPGVRAASLSMFGMLTGSQWTEGLPVPGTTARLEVDLRPVTPGYFATVGMKVKRGRPFTAADGRGAPPVVVVNETLARRFFGSAEAALGRRFNHDPHGSSDSVAEVVGVVADARTTHLRRQPQAAAFLPVAQDPDLLSSIEVRSDGVVGMGQLAERVRAALRQASPTIPVLSVKTMHGQREESLVQERLLASLSTGFGLAALFLVCIGLYGVVAEWAGQRTREIGVRIALGATTGSVRWMVLRQALELALAGVLIGLPAAMAVARLLEGLLFGLHPMDPRTLVLAGLTMFAVAAVAAYLPARRASRVEPMSALRCE